MKTKLAIAALLLTATPLSWLMAQTDGAAETPTFEKQKQEEELRGLKLQNDKLSQENQAAKAKALSDIFPASSTTGTTTAKDGAGKAEAAALAAAAVNGVADDIAREARAAAQASKGSDYEGPADCGNLTSLKPKTRTSGQVAPVLLLAADSSLSFSHFEQFRFRACALGEQFKKLLPPSEAGGAIPLVAVQAALAAGTKLLQLLTPDWEAGTIPVTTTNRALMAAVARAYVGSGAGTTGRVYWQGQVSKSGASDSIFKALKALGESYAKAGERINAMKSQLTEAKKKLDTVNANPRSSQAQKDKAKAEFDKWNNPTTALAEVRAAYEQLLKDLNGKESEALLPINRVVDQAAAAELLGTDGLALSLGVESSAGGYFTRKVIWNALGVGGPPFYVSGGAVVTYVAVRPADQQVLAAGLLTCSAPYQRIRRVAAATNGSAPISCTSVAAEGTTERDRNRNRDGSTRRAGNERTK